jgi:probable F420-dependent oxidoreductase
VKVRIGYAPGPFPPEAQGQDLLRQLVELGDEHGYDSLWLSDRVVGGRFPLEPLVALSMVAAYSDTLKFGTSVLALPLRNPVLLAKELATLDYLSKGRLLPAIGLGQDDPQEYEACGVSKEGRGRRADEAIEVIRRLWREDNVTHEGQFFTLHNVSVVPKPVQKPSPPIWVGGRSKAAQRRTGRLGDGWLVSQATPHEVAQGIELIFATAKEWNRTVDEDHIGTMLGFNIAPTVEEAALEAADHIIRHRPDVPFQEYCALGPPENVTRTINEYLAAGASKFVMRPMSSEHKAMEQLHLFGREVLPLFHA